MKKWKIIQASYPRTASTVLSNILYGFIFPEEPVDLGKGAADRSRNIIITHYTELDDWIDIFKDDFSELFFICSEREENRDVFPDKYRNREDILIFDFKELNEREDYGIKNIIDAVYYRVVNFLPTYIDLDKDSAIKRIEDMNKRYLEIKEKSFDFVDIFYHIHGSHRSRKKGHYT